MTTTLISPGFRPTPDEARDFVRRRPLSLTEWCERRLKITDGPISDAGGGVPFSVDLFPPQAAVLDAIENPRFNVVVLMSAPQTFGKTLIAAEAPALHAIQQRRVSAMYVAATRELAVTQWRKKFKRAIDADPELAALVPENPDFAGTKDRRDFVNGTSLHMVGAESIGSLSGYTSPVIICDDCHAMPENIPGYGHPADYAESRSRAFPAESVTRIMLGTASTIESWLYRTLKGSTFYVPFVPCPGCGWYQMIEFERLCYDSADPVAAAEECWLRCAHEKCTHEIRFDELPEMLDAMLWVSMPEDADWISGGGGSADSADAEDVERAGPDLRQSAKSADAPCFRDAQKAGLRVYPETDRRTTRAGFWANALYWPHGMTWGEHAAEFVACVGDPDMLKTFYQNTLTRPWREPESEGDLTPEILGEHKTPGHAWRTVPDEVDLVTMSVDVHSSGLRCLYCEVLGWRLADGTNWLIDAGTIGLHGPRKTERLGEAERWARWGAAIDGGLADAYEMERHGWPHKGGVIRAGLVLVDGGHRKDRVGPFCWTRTDTGPVRGRKWWMIRGDGGERQIIERAGAGRVRVQSPKGGFPYLRIGTDTAKHRLRDMLGVPRDHPGYCHFYVDRDLAAYFRHLSSETAELVRTPSGGQKMKWVLRAKGGANHWLDCRVYNIAAALLCGVRFVGEPGPDRVVRTNWFAQQKRRGRRPVPR